jgi:cysteinyl-tRNA synthetase
MTWNTTISAALFTAVILTLAATPAGAQNERGIRAQGQDVTGGEQNADQGGLPTPPELINPRQKMRDFIRAISIYTRRFNRDFVVVVEGGLELLDATDPLEGNGPIVASSYVRAIDGVLIDGLYYAPISARKKEEEDAVDKKVTEELLIRAKFAKENGLDVLVIDYPDNRANAQKSYSQNLRNGFVPFAAIDVGSKFNAVPSFPIRPFRENPINVSSLDDIRNFLQVLDSRDFGQQNEFVMKMHQSNFDALIIDVFHRDRQPFQKESVHSLKFKNLGAKRLVLASMNIGHAEAYRYYWKDDWREGSPHWIAAQVPGMADSYFVHYWEPEWNSIMNGNPQSYAYGIVAQGYDGIVIKGTDAFKFFETGQ